MTNVSISHPYISLSQYFISPTFFPHTRPQRDHLFGFGCLHRETIVPIIGIPQRMVLFNALEGGAFAHEKADFRGLVHRIGKTEHLRVTCRNGRAVSRGDAVCHDYRIAAGGKHR